MRKVWMTPTPSEAANDTTNAIHQIALKMAELMPAYGYEMVENPDLADLRVAHAGQGSSEPIDVAIYHGLYPTAQGFPGAYHAINSHVIHNLKTAKEIIAPSEWIADVIRRDMHINPHIVSWGVSLAEWTPGEQQHLYVLWNKARVDDVCNPAPMLELAKRASNVPFLSTFGNNPPPNVRVTGRQPYDVMKNYVRNAGVYLSTNVETFGLGILQACAAGVPVLGFRQGAIAEYLTHGVNAFLAEPGDMDGLYAGLEYCLKHREILGRNARQLATHFSWQETARKMAAVFDQALQVHTGPKVSIVIPCHDYGWCVGEAIQSALDQTPNFEYEIIVALDRCTDNSAEVVGRYSEAIRVIEADNGNLSATRNTGISAAKGEYIVCLDADDRLGSPKFLQTLADAMDADRTLGIAFTGITIMNEAGELGHLNAWPKGYNFDLQAQRKNQVPSCCMFRRRAWERAGGFRPYFKYAEDAEFWTTVGAIGYTAKQVTEQGWFHYRLHNKSASQVHRTGEIKEPDWLEFHPWAKDGLRPFAADGRPPLGSWSVRFYHEPQVSVIIPVGIGHEEAVKDALHSVEGQTFRMWECIVVNDTGAELDLTGFPWAKVVNNPKPLGTGAARNVGANKANSQALVFLDADDILKSEFLAEALHAYKRHGRYIYTDWITDDRKGKTETHKTLEYTHENLRERPSLHLVTALIPRKWFQEIGGFDETLTAFEDVDLFMNLYAHGFCGQRLARPLVVYNLDAGFRRKAGDADKAAFKTLLLSRYREVMESDKMCCSEPPKGLKPLPPNTEMENLAQYEAAYGEMIKVQYISPFAPVSPTTLRGATTRVNYGQRAQNDVFHIWEADYDPVEFARLDVYEVEAAQRTVVPPAPPKPPTEPEEPSPSEADTQPAEAVEPFEGWTRAELTEYAKDHAIPLNGARTLDTMKAAILAAS